MDLSKEETPLFIKVNGTTIAGKGSRTGQRQPSGILILLLPPCCHCLTRPWPLSKAPSVILTAFISFYLDYNDGIFLFVCANRGGRFWCLLFWGPAMSVTVAQRVPDISLREKSMNRNIFVHFKHSCSSLLSTLRDPPKVPYHPHRELCSRMADLLVVPRVFKSRMRDRAFIFQVPLLLNQLSVWMWKTDTISTFRIGLKTVLFDNA